MYTPFENKILIKDLLFVFFLDEEILRHVFEFMKTKHKVVEIQ